MRREAHVLAVSMLSFGVIALAQDIAVNNPEAIVPENSVPGLAELAGEPIGRIPGSFPSELLAWLEIPTFSQYLGMSRNGAPESHASAVSPPRRDFAP